MQEIVATWSKCPMAKAPTLVLSDINTFLRDRMETLLCAGGIYKIDDYGFSGPDDYDEEFIGHAMQQTDSLSFRVLDAHAWPASRIGPLTDWQQFQVAAESDFEGIMKAARTSIGLTMLQRQASVGDHYEDESFFQVHLIASQMLLGAASDRLRDAFVAGVFNRTDFAGWFQAPFVEVAANVTEYPPCLADSLSALPPLAERIHAFRAMRNTVVHETATEIGRVYKRMAGDFPVEPTNEWIPYAEVVAGIEKAEAEHQARVDVDLGAIVEWYKLLVDASHHGFRVIVILRHARGDPFK
jgi:hypothetical protein